MGVLSNEDFDYLNILAEAVCSIAQETLKQQEERENVIPPKKRSSFYFDFLKNMSNPSNNNRMPSTSEEGKGLVMMRRNDDKLESTVVVVDEEEKSRNQQEQLPLLPKLLPLLPKIKQRSHGYIQKIPNLLEDCCPHPKKPRSPSNSTITIFGQKITMARTSPPSTNYSNATAESDHIPQTQPIINNATLKRKYSDDDASNKKENLKMKRVVNEVKKVKFTNDLPTPDLPEEFKQVILGQMSGTKLQLLAQKTLYHSDIKKDQGRFPMPREQTSSKIFLKRLEKKMLRKRKFLLAPLIDPLLVERHIALGSWKMSAKSNTYVLKSTWNNIVEDHHLGIGDVVQVWAFRAINPYYKIDRPKDGDSINNDEGDKGDDAYGDDDDEEDGIDVIEDDVDDQLHLALVLVKSNDPIPKGKGSKESTTTNGGSSGVSNNECEGSASCSSSHKGQEIVGGSRTGSCSPENN